MPRSDAIKEGKAFLGEGYQNVEPGRYVSADGYRQMRFDLTHHDGLPAHINLETWKKPIQTGTRNKLISNIHIFFE